MSSASWDVVSTQPITLGLGGSGFWGWHPPTDGFVAHGSRLVGFARESGPRCGFVTFAAPDWSPTARPVEACDGAISIGTAAVAGDLVIGCTSGTPAERPVAFAVDAATGNLAWTLTPQEAGGVAGTWGCGRAARIGPDLVLPMWGRTNVPIALGADGEEALNRVVRLDALTGEVVWSRQVSAAAIVADAFGVSGYDDLIEAPHLQLVAAAAVGEGFVLTATLGEERVLIQIAGNGEFRGSIRQSASPYGRPGASFSQTVVDTRATEAAIDEAWGAAPGNIFAASDGAAAYMAWGSEFFVADPFAPRPLASLALEEALGPAHPFRGPTISTTAIIVPMTYGVAAVDPATMTLLWARTLPQVFLGGVWDVAVAGDGNILVVADDTRSRLQLLVLAPDNGRTIGQLRLPIGPSERFFVDKVHVDPLPGGAGALVWDREGAAVLLQPRAGSGIDVLAQQEYPAIGEPLKITSLPPQTGFAGQVVWGDGAVSILPADTFTATHAFREAGEHTIRWTWLDPDLGTTWTGATTVDVGGAPPPRLNFLQRAFAPENQDLTWGIIGLVVAFFGGIGAYAVRRWQRHGIGKDLRQLEGLRLQSGGDPIGAMHGLRTYSRSLRQRAAAGKLESAEFIPLSHEAQALSHAVRQRVLSTFEGRIGGRLRHVVEAALADGVLTTDERVGIAAGLGREKGLSQAERGAFHRLLSEWS